MSDIKYKVVKEADNARILQLYRAAGWWQMDENPQYLKTVAGIIAGSFCFVIAEKEGEIIGMGRAISDGFSDAYIQDVMVLDEHRGHGYGKGIVKKLIAFLKEHKIQWIGLISEPGYDSFYKDLGFDVMRDYVPFLLGDAQ